MKYKRSGGGALPLCTRFVILTSPKEETTTQQITQMQQQVSTEQLSTAQQPVPTVVSTVRQQLSTVVSTKQPSTMVDVSTTAGESTASQELSTEQSYLSTSVKHVATNEPVPAKEQLSTVGLSTPKYHVSTAHTTEVSPTCWAFIFMMFCMPHASAGERCSLISTSVTWLRNSLEPMI